jgi:hypothetical protein
LIEFTKRNAEQKNEGKRSVIHGFVNQEMFLNGTVSSDQNQSMGAFTITKTTGAGIGMI